jgi:hypothetical protein
LTFGKARPEEVLELTAPLSGEDTSQTVAGEAEEIGDTAIRGVVEIGHTSERQRCVSENGRETKHVVAVVPDLKHWVRDWPLAVLLDSDEGVAVLKPLRVTLLLQLDDEV